MEELVAADPFDLPGVRRHDEERRLRVVLAQLPVRRGSKLEARPGHVRDHQPSWIVLVRAEDDVVADQELEGAAALDVDVQAARRRVERDRGADREGRPFAAVDPTCAGRAHLECRRDAQQLPAPLGLHEDALAAALEHVERSARDAQELVERRVPDRELGTEHAAHPGRDGEGVVTGEQVAAGLQDVPGRSLHDELLGLQHDVLLAAMEERQERPVPLLDVAALQAEEAFEVGRPEILALEHDGCIEEAGRSRSRRPVGQAAATAPKRGMGGDRSLCVRGARGGRVVRLEGSEEPDLPDLPWREREPR